MSKVRLSPWHLLLLSLVFTFPAHAQQHDIDAWDVIGDYTCARPDGDTPPTKIFLLPDMSWDSVAPFSLLSLRSHWIGPQTFGWHGRLPYGFQYQRIFKVRSDIVELYSAALVDDVYAARMGSQNSFFRGLMKIERPSALPPLPPPPQADVWATLLLHSFRFDRNASQLIEILPLENARLPVRCDQHPLFTGDLFL